MGDKTILRKDFSTDGKYRQAISTYRILLRNKGFIFNEYAYEDRYIFGEIRSK